MSFLKIIQSIEQQALFNRGDRILVGVSGGVDSLALLDVLHRLSVERDWRVYAAHLNHCFRGEESKEDAEFVRRFCEERKIPCKIGEADTPKMIREQKLNPQVAAREARYAFFRSVAKEWSIDAIALAHHANDQAETVFMRILRGTGIDGLTGIPRVRTEGDFRIARPLLSINKEDLIAYCEQRQITPREDSSNQKTNYHRNFLRLSVLPWLEETVNPSLQNALVQLSEIAIEENDLLHALTEEASRQVLDFREGNEVILERKQFLNCHLALQRRLIKLIFTYLCSNDANFGFIHIHHICEWIKDGRASSRLQLPNGAIAEKVYDRVTFRIDLSIHQENSDQLAFSYELEIPGRTYINETRTWFVAEIVHRPFSWSVQSEEVAMFDADQIKGSLIARNRRNGDKMGLFGMKGAKKVKDLFIDRKIPLAQRARVPILGDDEGIVWIPGVRRSDRALITEQTRRALIIRVEKDDWTTGGNDAK